MSLKMFESRDAVPESLRESAIETKDGKWAVADVEGGPCLLAPESRGLQLGEVEATPLLRHAEEHQLLPRADGSDEERPRRCGEIAVLDLPRERLDAADHVRPSVLHQGRFDGVAVPAVHG